MTKICKLITQWPSGAIKLQAGLEKQQVYKQLSNKYVESGWLEKIGVGAYIRAGEKPTWQGGVYAVQQDLNLPIHVGGASSLELFGISHFVPLGNHTHLYLFVHGENVPRYLPRWFIDLKDLTIDYTRTQIFSSQIGLTTYNCGNFEITVSAPERALFEVLDLVPTKISFDHACLLLASQNQLRNDLIEELLFDCRSQVLKRFFLYMAQKFSLRFMDYVSIKNVDLGRGPRRIGEGDVFDSKLNLYVPRMDPNIDPDQEVPDV